MPKNDTPTLHRGALNRLHAGQPTPKKAPPAPKGFLARMKSEAALTIGTAKCVARGLKNFAKGSADPAATIDKMEKKRGYKERVQNLRNKNRDLQNVM